MRAEAEAGVGDNAADAGEGDVAGAGDLLERAAAVRADGDDDAGLRFAEERGVEAGPEHDVGGVEAFVAGEAHLGEGDGEAAVGAVVAGGRDVLADEGEDGAVEAGFEPEVDRQRAADEAVHLFQVLAAGQRFDAAARRGSRGGRRRRLPAANAMRR